MKMKMYKQGEVSEVSDTLMAKEKPQAGMLKKYSHAEDHAYDALRYGVMSRTVHPKSYDANRYTEKEKFKPADRVFGY